MSYSNEENMRTKGETEMTKEEFRQYIAESKQPEKRIPHHLAALSKRLTRLHDNNEIELSHKLSEQMRPAWELFAEALQHVEEDKKKKVSELLDALLNDQSTNRQS